MIREKIIRTLNEATPGLELLEDDFFVIGASAIILSGIEIGNTNDIDILTSTRDSAKLKKIWNDKIENNPLMKESELFKSDFSRYSFSEMDIEIEGDLLVYKENHWLEVNVHKYVSIEINNLFIKIPTIEEQMRILRLFGREKDMKRLKLMQNTMY
ncbi:hypothetical protein GGR21_003428 [Dysgonomonas hofstadii]|uniref:Nucleotidyltransferase n=1 Tax=Dysgonomonas hofstadii TaxID=637886 RepID=A0A840CR35_9BACT|nr:hypothetical protein [Dysgonomonas hofstadii]MBB4037511.1 hypothetical protein [Dysgonomonas hofstadii]